MNSLMPKTYALMRHTDHPTHCWRVVGMTDESTDYYGYGMTEGDAAYLLRQLELDDASWAEPRA